MPGLAGFAGFAGLVVWPIKDKGQFSDSGARFRKMGLVVVPRKGHELTSTHLALQIRRRSFNTHPMLENV